MNLGAAVPLAIIIAAAGFAGGYDYEHARAKAAMDEHLAADAKATSVAEIAARTHEYELGIAAGKVAESYEQGKKDAQAQADLVAADLLSGNLRLQNRWAGCEADRAVAAAAATRKLDAATEDRMRSASRIVRAAAACDSQVRGLQALVITERQ